LSLASKIPAASTALPWTDEVAFLKDTFSNLPAGAAGGENADVRWARFQQHGGWWPSATALPASAQPASLPPKASPLAAPQYQGDQAEFPYYLNLYMSELLSDGRGANQPWLQGVPDTNTSIAWQTWVEINPSTAQKLGVKEGDIVQIASPYGEVEALVYPYPAIRPDTVSIPLGQGHTDYGRYAKDRGSNAIALVGAQSGSNAENLVWDTVRVKITPTGKHKSLATFENTVGVTEGFINQAFPGQ
jgi:anaerobic selenocysteine-containing dehydrogenase